MGNNLRDLWQKSNTREKLHKQKLQEACAVRPRRELIGEATNGIDVNRHRARIDSNRLAVRKCVKCVEQVVSTECRRQ